MSYGRHRVPREPRWHDRPRAWLRAALDWLSGTLNDDAPQPYWEGTDDNGEAIDLPPVRPCLCEFGNEPIWVASDIRGCPRHGGGSDQDGEPRVIRTAKVSGVHLPLSGDNVNWTVNCAFAKDVPRADERPPGSEVAGPGYRQNVPRPGGNGNPSGRVHTGPGHLSMFDLTYVRSPWPARPDDTFIISGPRVCAGRIALLAGAR